MSALFIGLLKVQNGVGCLAESPWLRQLVLLDVCHVLPNHIEKIEFVRFNQLERFNYIITLPGRQVSESLLIVELLLADLSYPSFGRFTSPPFIAVN